MLLNPYTFTMILHFHCCSMIIICYWILTLSLFSLLISNTRNYKLQIAIPNHDFHHHQKRTIWQCKFLRGIDLFCWCGSPHFWPKKAITKSIRKSMKKSTFIISIMNNDMLLLNPYSLNICYYVNDVKIDSKHEWLWYWILTLSMFYHKINSKLAWLCYWILTFSILSFM